MPIVPPLDPSELVRIVNHFATQTRAASALTGTPYPLPARFTPQGWHLLAARDLVALADSMWPVFAADSDEERATLLNLLLAAGAVSPRISTEGSVAWYSSRKDAEALAVAAAVCLLTAVQKMGWPRIGLCAAVDCLDVYIDETAHNVRRYCSDGCLNRSRVRAFRARQATGGAQQSR